MSLSDGVLKAEEKQKIVDWLNRKTKDYTCPVCQTNAWTIGDHLLRGDVYTPGVVNLGGAAYPFAMVICNNCYYVRHFMALPMGIGGEPTKTPDSPEKNGGESV